MNTSNLPALLPCPFCGGAAEYRIDEWGGKPRYRVVCKCPVGNKYFNAAEAADGWNARAAIASQAQGEVAPVRLNRHADGLYWIEFDAPNGVKALLCLNNVVEARLEHSASFTTRAMTEALAAPAAPQPAQQGVAATDVEIDQAGVPRGEWGGLSPKQAWWAGYRVGKGLPPDMPRKDAVRAAQGQQGVAVAEAVAWYYERADQVVEMEWGLKPREGIARWVIRWLYETPESPEQKPFAWKFHGGAGWFLTPSLVGFDHTMVEGLLYNRPNQTKAERYAIFDATQGEQGAPGARMFDPTCVICRGSGRFVTGTSGREDDGNAPIFEDCECWLDRALTPIPFNYLPPGYRYLSPEEVQAMGLDVIPVNLVAAPQPAQQAAEPVAPWPDFVGQPIKHGARLLHPDGTEFVAIRLSPSDEPGDAWRAVYYDATISRLGLQIGDKGRAVLAAPQAVQQGVADALLRQSLKALESVTGEPGRAAVDFKLTDAAEQALKTYFATQGQQGAPGATTTIEQIIDGTESSANLVSTLEAFAHASKDDLLIRAANRIRALAATPPPAPVQKPLPETKGGV